MEVGHGHDIERVTMDLDRLVHRARRREEALREEECGRRRARARAERSDFVISFTFSFVLQVPSYTGGSPTGRFDYKCWAAFTLWATHDLYWQ